MGSLSSTAENSPVGSCGYEPHDLSPNNIKQCIHFRFGTNPVRVSIPQFQGLLSHLILFLTVLVQPPNATRACTTFHMAGIMSRIRWQETKKPLLHLRDVKKTTPLSQHSEIWWGVITLQTCTPTRIFAFSAFISRIVVDWCEGLQFHGRWELMRTTNSLTPRAQNRNSCSVSGISFYWWETHTITYMLIPHSMTHTRKKFRGLRTGRVRAIHLQSSPDHGAARPSSDALSSMRCQRFCLVRRVSRTMDIQGWWIPCQWLISLWISSLDS